MHARQLWVTTVAAALLCHVAGYSQGTNTHWTVPAKPDPHTILIEATEDASAGRYEDALAKQVWFHENAVKIDPSLVGVRLSFALTYWVELGKSYPPALSKLKSIRNENDKQIREGKTSRLLFAEFESINKCLAEETRTKDTFVWLDTNAPAFAKQVFNLAERDLVDTKEYRLCNKYIDPNASFQHMLDLYQELMHEGKSDPVRRDFAHDQFSNHSATLVAILAINGRTSEADEIAIRAEKVLNDPQFKSLLENAKKGDVPKPWP